MAIYTSAAPAPAAATGVGTSTFWERLWRTSGIQFVAFFIVTYLICGYQPPVGAPLEALGQFYVGDRTRVLVAVIFSGLNMLNLMWFASALRTALSDAGQQGWGSAATASASAFAALYLAFIAVVGSLAYSIAATGNPPLTSALNDLAWALLVLTCFPRAMLVMAGTFGFWRAGLISKGLFTAGVVVVILGVLGGTTWLSGGPWAPDGAYSRFVLPAIELAWILAASWILLARTPVARAGW